MSYASISDTEFSAASERSVDMRESRAADPIADLDYRLKMLRQRQNVMKIVNAACRR